MHYTRRGSPIIPRQPHTPSTTYNWKEDVEDRVERLVVPRVPSNTWRDLLDDRYDDPLSLPLRYDTSLESIAMALLPHATGSELKTNAVYVLECLSTSDYLSSAVRIGVNPGYRWDRVDTARRALYVGVAQNLIKRLDQHLNSPGYRGANFTGTFPPIRVLDVSWWTSYERAEYAEPLVAKGLRDRFPNDYVSQPG